MRLLNPMNRLYTILIALLATVLLPGAAFAAADAHESAEGGKLDPKEIIFEHLGDAYGWEVPFDHHHRIPLPIIVYGTDGFHCFSSSRISGGETYDDNGVLFRLAPFGSPHQGKVVEIVNGEEVRPIDISITKNVAALFVSVLLVAGIMLWLAAFHRRNRFKAPRKGLGAVEACVTFIYSGVIKPTLGPQAKRFAPYLMTVFFFILAMNRSASSWYSPAAPISPATSL